MKVALISDIHGNAAALETVFDDLKSEHVDHIVCLGDIIADGPQPREVLTHLKERNIPVVKGNMDAWFLDPPRQPGTSKNSQRGHDIRCWDLDQLSPEDLDDLRALPITLEIALDQNTTLLCYHASPPSYYEGISSTKSKEDLDRMLSGHHATVLAGGHTHTPMVRHHNDIILVNPGSVGAPRSARIPQTNQNHHPAWAEYGIIQWENETLQINLRRVPIDSNLIKQAAINSGMPHAEWWVQSRYPRMDSEM